jgi:hypothetical protein
MLLEKPIKTNDIVSLKLISGEELIGSYQGEDDTHYSVDKPVCLVPVEKGMSFAPFMMTSQAKRFKVNRNTVVALSPTAEELAKNYTQQTTDIQLV